MKDVSIEELKSADGSVKVAIIVYVGSGDPVRPLNEAVSVYVAGKQHEEFINADFVTPWVRIIVSCQSLSDFVPFDPDVHRL